MTAFILEILISSGWRRGGEIFWTLEDATSAGRRLIKRRVTRQVRVLPADVKLTPVAQLPTSKIVIPNGLSVEATHEEE